MKIADGKVECKKCKEHLKYGTTSMANHMKRKHHLVWTKTEHQKLERYVNKFDPKLVTRHLSTALAQSTAPYRLVENINFIKALKCLNPEYICPSHQTISRNIFAIHYELLTKLKCYISNATCISICCDFWTGKDLCGYLGVTASFIEKSERRNFLLALKYIEYPHTALKVRDAVEDVLIEFGLNGIDDNRLVSISTDNGSNMVSGLSTKANLVEQRESAEYENSEEACELEEAAEDEEMIIEISDNEELEAEEPLFVEISYNKRIPCINHILNNNLKNSVAKVPEIQETLRDAKEFIRKIKGRGAVNDYMKANKVQKLLLPPLTRWQYFSEMCNSLLKAKHHFPIICNLAQTDNLTIDTYKSLEKLNSTFEIYSKLIYKFEQIDSKLSDVIPAILSLFVNLDNPLLNHQLSHELKQDLVKRTKCIFDSTSKHFNLIFALSTYLDPVNRKYLAIEMADFSMSELSSMVKLHLKTLCSSNTTSSKKTKTDFGNLDSFLPNQADKIDELARYEIGEWSIENNLNSLIAFWENSAFESLKAVAQKLLTASASSSMVENVFSVSSNSFGPRRTRLESQNLERETMIRFNKSLIN